MFARASFFTPRVHRHCNHNNGFPSPTRRFYPILYAHTKIVPVYNGPHCTTLTHLNCFFFFFLERNSEQVNHVRRSRFNLVFVGILYVCTICIIYIYVYILISFGYFLTLLPPVCILYIYIYSCYNIYIYIAYIYRSHSLCERIDKTENLVLETY